MVRRGRRPSAWRCSRRRAVSSGGSGLLPGLRLRRTVGLRRSLRLRSPRGGRRGLCWLGRRGLRRTIAGRRSCCGQWVAAGQAKFAAGLIRGAAPRTRDHVKTPELPLRRAHLHGQATASIPGLVLLPISQRRCEPPISGFGWVSPVAPSHFWRREAPKSAKNARSSSARASSVAVLAQLTAESFRAVGRLAATPAAQRSFSSWMRAALPERSRK